MHGTADSIAVGLEERLPLSAREHRPVRISDVRI